MGGYGKFRLQPVAVGGGEEAVLVGLEVAGPGVVIDAVALDLEEALALNGHVHFVLRVDVLTLGKNLGDARGSDPQPYLLADGHLPAAGQLPTGLAHGLVKQVFKIPPALLETGGVDVGQVVGDDVEPQLLGPHTGGGGKHPSKHSLIL